MELQYSAWDLVVMYFGLNNVRGDTHYWDRVANVEPKILLDDVTAARFGLTYTANGAFALGMDMVPAMRECPATVELSATDLQTILEGVAACRDYPRALGDTARKVAVRLQEDLVGIKAKEQFDLMPESAKKAVLEQRGKAK